MIHRISKILSLFLGFLPASLFAELSVASYYGDHMVLQRDQPICVWGTATPGAEVQVSLSSQKASGKAEPDGKWKVMLGPLPASGPFELKVDSGSEKAGFKDLMVGDVWLVSGQSNMVLALQSTTEWPAAKTAGAFPAIRICKLPGDFSFTPAEKYSRGLQWMLLDSPRAGFFSAVGYHFARTLQPAIGVTVGIVQGSVGGTQAEQWTRDADLKAAIPDNPLIAEAAKARAESEANPTAKANIMKAGASVLYNGIIHPMRYAKFAGVVWYQGEANSRSPRDYRPVLKTLVQSWRGVFGQPQLPFVIVQLPNFGLPKDDGWMRVQEAQRLAAKDLGLPLVVTIDQGSATTIHPPNKAEVGRRVGVAALQSIYKKDVEGTSPNPSAVKFQGQTAVVDFDGFKGNLVVRGASVQGFEIAGTDKHFYPATAAVEGRSVKLSNTSVSQPKAVRYLWANSPEAVTLYSPAGLPAVPFRFSEGEKL